MDLWKMFANVFAVLLVFVAKNAQGFTDSSDGLFALANSFDKRTNTDAVFVVDVSNGLKESTFLKLRSLAIKSFSCFGFPKTNRLSLVAFSNTASTLINFNSCKTRSCFVNKFKKIKYGKGNKVRAINPALRAARGILKNTGRKTASKVVILLVSGNSNRGRNPSSAARRLKNMKAELFIVGVGRIPTKDQETLRRLAGSRQRYISIAKPDQDVSMANLLVDIMCTSAGSTGTSFKIDSLLGSVSIP